MRKTWLFAIVLAAGCSDAAKDIEKFADRACECKDKGCGEKVILDFAQFARDNANATGDQERANKAAKRMTECVLKSGVDPHFVMDKLQHLGE